MLIAQISDIHATSGNDSLHRLDRVLAWLAQLGPDVLVITGDLIDDQWLEGYERIASRLRQQTYPALLLPGNSDHRGQMQSVWGSQQWAPDSPEGTLNFNFDLAGLHLLGVDLTIENEDYGSVYGQLEWLEKQLINGRHSPSLLLMHHHVFASDIPGLDKTMCRGVDKLTDVILRAPGKVMAVSTGHVHRPISSMLAGNPAYVCGSVCPANPVWFGAESIPSAEDPPALMIHRYAGNVLTSHHVSV